MAADPRAGAGIAIGVVRCAEPLGGKLGRERPQIPRSHRRDLFDYLQSEPALLLFPENASRRSRADPLLRLGTRGSGAVFRPYSFDDPTSPPAAPPRESLEVRTLVFFS